MLEDVTELAPKLKRLPVDGAADELPAFADWNPLKGSGCKELPEAPFWEPKPLNPLNKEEPVAGAADEGPVFAGWNPLKASGFEESLEAPF